MSHSLTKIWIHAVFSTKDRAPLITEKIEHKLYSYIKSLLEEEYNSPTKIINGTTDHIHTLFLLNQSYSISKIIKAIKGNSSHWINQNNLIRSKFAWQTGYGAFSVSESILTETERYIAHQKEHHKKMSFTEEYDKFLLKYKLNLVNR